jgi:hypothetical protein
LVSRFCPIELHVDGQLSWRARLGVEQHEFDLGTRSNLLFSISPDRIAICPKFLEQLMGLRLVHCERESGNVVQQAVGSVPAPERLILCSCGAVLFRFDVRVSLGQEVGVPGNDRGCSSNALWVRQELGMSRVKTIDAPAVSKTLNLLDCGFRMRLPGAGVANQGELRVIVNPQV